MYEGEESFLASPLYRQVFHPFGLRYLMANLGPLAERAA